MVLFFSILSLVAVFAVALYGSHILNRVRQESIRDLYIERTYVEDRFLRGGYASPEEYLAKIKRIDFELEELGGHVPR